MSISEIRSFFVKITKRAEDREMMKSIGKLRAMLFRNPLKAVARIREIASYAETHDDLLRRLDDMPGLIAGHVKVFNAFDIRPYLFIAAQTDVPFIPATEVLRMAWDDMSQLSTKFTITGGLEKKAAAFEKALLEEFPELDELEREPKTLTSRQELLERITAALDDQPNNIMVRHTGCGPSSLKTLVGVGYGQTTDKDSQAPEAAVGAGVVVGPGWVRLGNRRIIDVMDHRFITCGYTPNHTGDQVFLARPWIQPSRYWEARDPHRENTPIAGAGRWPCEWRCFIANGVVTGVSAYYPWACSMTTEDAQMALEVRRRAQVIADKATELRLTSANPEVEMTRLTRRCTAEDLAKLTEIQPDGFTCTIDMIETKDGPTLIEGGPYQGHPCGFAGKQHRDGIAFRTMPHINLMNEKFVDGDSSGVHMSWDDCREKALEGASA
jgi:hypothetical protein